MTSFPCIRRCLLLPVIALLPLLAFADAPRPNIVVLLADDLGWGDISRHGATVPTPHLDRLFNQSIELETFLVMPVCSPTRAAFLTGRHSTRSGVGPNTVNARVGEMMNPRETTLAKVFQSAGYRTALIGKWHLGYAPSDPNSHGFDLFHGFLGAATDYLDRTDDPHTRWMLNDQPVSAPGYSTDVIRDRSIQFIGENKSRPFLLYTAFNAVHNPVQATQAYIDRAPAFITDPHARTRAGMVIALDDAVGAIVKKIDDEGLGARTVIVFFSDNGPTPDGNAGPFRGRKHTVWEGGVRSPTAIRWTGRFKPGVTQAMLATEDLFPTLLKLAGVPAPKGIPLDGYDFSACLTGKAPSPRQEYHWIWNDCDAIRTARYKLVRYADRKELYDLQNDIGETKDLAKELPGVVLDMERRLDALQAAVPIYPSHVSIKSAGALKAEPSGQVLEVRAVRDGKSREKEILGLSLGACAPFQIHAGDRLEFDLLFAHGSATEGLGIDFRHPERQKQKGRVRGGFNEDSEGLGAAAHVGRVPSPGAPGFNEDIEGAGAAAVSAGQQHKAEWSRRVTGLANSSGRMLDTLWLSIEGRQPANYHFYLDNIVIRRADGTVIEFYRNGPAPDPKRRDAPGYAGVIFRSMPLAEVTVK